MPLLCIGNFSPKYGNIFKAIGIFTVQDFLAFRKDDGIDNLFCEALNMTSNEYKKFVIKAEHAVYDNPPIPNYRG